MSKLLVLSLLFCSSSHAFESRRYSVDFSPQWPARLQAKIEYGMTSSWHEYRYYQSNEGIAAVWNLVSAGGSMSELFRRIVGNDGSYQPNVYGMIPHEITVSFNRAGDWEPGVDVMAANSAQLVAGDLDTNLSAGAVTGGYVVPTSGELYRGPLTRLPGRNDDSCLYRYTRNLDMLVGPYLVSGKVIYRIELVEQSHTLTASSCDGAIAALRSVSFGNDALNLLKRFRFDDDGSNAVTILQPYVLPALHAVEISIPFSGALRDAIVLR